MEKKVVLQTLICSECGAQLELEPGDKIYDFGWSYAEADKPICLECDNDDEASQ